MKDQIKYIHMYLLFVKQNRNLSSVFFNVPGYIVANACQAVFLCLHRTKAKFFRHLPDWCRYLLTWGSFYIGGQLHHKTQHSSLETGIMGGFQMARFRGIQWFVCVYVHVTMLGAWCLESPPEGILPGGEEGDVKHIEWEKSSCWALKAPTCHCCLYVKEQKRRDVVKRRRQSWLKYSVDSCSGGDSAHCGGPACDVSAKGSQPGMRLPLCVLEATTITWIHNTPGHIGILLPHNSYTVNGYQFRNWFLIKGTNLWLIDWWFGLNQICCFGTNIE